MTRFTCHTLTILGVYNTSKTHYSIWSFYNLIFLIYILSVFLYNVYYNTKVLKVLLKEIHVKLIKVSFSKLFVAKIMFYNEQTWM